MNSVLTKGEGLSTVFRFSLPLILGAFIQQIYAITDSLIVGNVEGSFALAAIGATGSTLFLLFSINSGLANGCSVIIAQSIGAEDEQKVRKSLASTVYFSLLCGLMISVISILFVGPLLKLMQTPSDVLPLAKSYLSICAGVCIGQVLYNNMAAVLHAFGDGKTPLLFLIVCTILNILLDLLLVAGAGLGVAGAAIATVISQFISGFLCLLYAVRKYPQLRLKLSDFRPDVRNIGEIAAVGVPMAFQSSVLAAGDVIIMSTINSFETATVAAYAAAARIHQFCVIPYLQFAIAFSTFAAQNIGAGLVSRIRKTMLQSSLYVVGTAAILAVIIRFVRLFLLSFFIPATDPLYADVMRIGGDFLAIVPPFYLFLGLIWLYNYMLRGVGAKLVPLISSGIELAAKIILPYRLGVSFGYRGVWYGFTLCWILGWIPSVLYYCFGKWPDICCPVPAESRQ